MGGLIKFKKDSRFQRIQAHFLDDKIVLTAKEQELYHRMKFIFSLRLRNKYSKQQAVTKTIEEFGVSPATAYRDYAAACALYGDIDDVDTRGEKMVLREERWFLYQNAIKERNWEAANKILDSYERLFDFTDRSGDIEPDKIAAHTYHMKISKKMEKIILSKLEKGVIDLNNVGVEDIDFEEVKDDQTKP